jgi:hypothetical protein
VEPVVLVNAILKKGLQGLVLTDHRYLWTEPETADLRKEAQVPKAFLLMSAQEAQTDIGHVLVYGAGKTVAGDISLSALREEYPEAALIWAHPFRKGNVPKDSELMDKRLDAVEIISSNHSVTENLLGINLWHRLKFTAVAGSDAHGEETCGVFPTQFDHFADNMKDLVTEIKKGRCRPFLKEIPKAGSNLSVTEITIGTKGADEVRQRLITKRFTEKRKWEKAGRSTGIVKRIYASGFDTGAYRVPNILDIDNRDRVIIEQGQRGKSLHDLLLAVNADTGREYVKMCARWLAKLHGLRLKTGSLSETIDKERQRFRSYEKSFRKTDSPYLKQARSLIDFAKESENALFKKRENSFFLVHGDFQPKNIIIGQDMQQDFRTLFASVIDFDGSFLMMPEFDVGCFLAQFSSQFGDQNKIMRDYPQNLFTDAYLLESGGDKGEFLRLADIFIIRANLSIASYLIKVGLGESEKMKRCIDSSTELLRKLS